MSSIKINDMLNLFPESSSVTDLTSSDIRDTGDMRLTDLLSPTDEKIDYAQYLEDLSIVEERWTDDRAFWPTTIVYGLIFVVGILGNLLVIFSLTGDRRSLHSVTAVLLVSLVSADLLFLLICVPYEMVTKLTAARWAGSRALCKLSGFVEMLSASGAVLNLTAISVER